MFPAGVVVLREMLGPDAADQGEELPGRRRLRPLLDDRQEVRDREGVLDAVKAMPGGLRIAHEVDMRVDQSRHDRAAAEIDELRGRTQCLGNFGLGRPARLERGQLFAAPRVDDAGFGAAEILALELEIVADRVAIRRNPSGLHGMSGDRRSA